MAKASFRFHVFPSSGVPIYRQIMEQVQAQLASGRLKPGQFLPSVRQASRELAVNPMTVSKAYSLLERDGIVALIRGQGMRVNERGPGGSRKQRQRELEPLLEQVVAKAYQLSMSPEEVLAVLEPMLDRLARESG